MSESKEPRIDAEVCKLLPPHTPAEAETLERLMLESGRAEQSLVVWDEENILLDGHHRLRLCRKHNLPYEVLRKSFPSRADALLWVLRHQGGRRNMTPEQLSYARGKEYLLAKEAAGEGPNNGQDLSARGQNVHQPPGGEKIAEAVARRCGVNEKTVRRDAAYAEAVEKVAAGDDDAQAAILSGTMPVTKGDVIAAAKAPEPAKALEEKRKARAGRAEKSPMEVRKTALEALGVAFRCADRLKVYGQVGGLLEQAKKVFYDWRPEN